MPFYDKVTKIVYTDQLWNLEWQPYVQRTPKTSSLYAVIESQKNKLYSSQQLTDFYNSVGIRVKPLSELIDNKFITQLIEVSAKAYILNGKYCEYKTKQSCQAFCCIADQLGIPKGRFKGETVTNRNLSEKDILFWLLGTYKPRSLHISEQLKKKGISPSIYYSRLKLGWSKEKAMTTPMKARNEVVYDHKGNKFKSQKEMLDFYGIPWSTFNKRKKQGLSLEKCLHPTKGRKTYKMIEDHKGNQFKSQKEMLKFYGISQSAFDKRRKKGLSLEECLAKTDKVVCDHKGKQFNSMRDMLKFHGVTTSVFYARKKQGLSLEKCLTKKEKVIYDHKGNQFRSQKEMFEFYGVPEAIYHSRKKRGLSLEECLRPHKPIKLVQDHLGNQFKSQKEMFEFYGVSDSTFYDRKKQGLSLEECLRPTNRKKH
ncbi:hypothetical protein [Streptococcus hyointestinalis]|uniref:hypothetical protein n=1 Tax=Streptococcus hyointestinalis TaxID=1337 RepID=UPI003F9D792D